MIFGKMRVVKNKYFGMAGCNSKRKTVLVFFGAFLFFVSALLTYNLLRIFEKPKEEDTVREKYSLGKKESQDLREVYNILLLGYGGEGHDGGGLSDAMMLANIDFENEKINLVSIPRDIWIELPVRSDMRSFFKINTAFAIGGDDINYPLKEPVYKGDHGGGEMAKYAVSEVVGMPVDYYIAVDFGGFVRAIDKLGGIKVDVPVSFEDYFYPVKGLENEICGKTPEEIDYLHKKYNGFQLEKQFECRYEHLRFDSGSQHMDGETALKFVRSRHSLTHGGDISRSERQQALIKGVMKKLIKEKSVNEILSFFEEVTLIIKTDIDVQLAVDIAKRVPEPDKFLIENINLSEENVLKAGTGRSGQFIFIPKDPSGDWDAVHKFIQDEIAK